MKETKLVVPYMRIHSVLDILKGLFATDLVKQSEVFQ